MAETAFDYITSEDYATFFTDEVKWIRKLTALSKTHPDEVKIIYTPEQNHGALYAYVPKTWFKLSPPKKMSLTDEQRAAAAERMSKARKAKKGAE